YNSCNDVLTSHLISTLNLSFSDYNFVNANFNYISLGDCKKEALDFFNVVNSEIGGSIVESLFIVIQNTVDIKNCDVFCYENREGPFEDCVWFFCFLFYGKKEKRIVLFVGMLKNK
ncbi:RNA polymerase III-inhibiting protein maf1, partial [Conglomerata obtusa]